MTTSNFDFRSLAGAHHQRAGQLLASGDPVQGRHACLELRMALECLTYDLLQLYRDDVDDAVLEMWQAGKILDALVTLDPDVEATIELRVASEDADLETPILNWHEDRLDLKWTKKAYATLGHFLHERTFAELERGVIDDPAKIRERALSIHGELGRVLASSGWNLRIKETAMVACDCGDQAVFSMSPRQLFSRARCSACGADYDVRSSPDRPSSVEIRRRSDA